MKKKYIAPALELIDLPLESHLLEGSLNIKDEGATEEDVHSSKRPGSWSEDIWGESTFGALK